MASLKFVFGSILGVAVAGAGSIAVADSFDDPEHYMVDAFSNRLTAQYNGRVDGRLRPEQLRLKTNGDQAGGSRSWAKYDISSLSFDNSETTDVTLSLTLAVDSSGVQQFSESNPFAIELWAINDGLAAMDVPNVNLPDNLQGGSSTVTATQQGEDFQFDLLDDDITPANYGQRYTSTGIFPYDNGLMQGGFAGGPGQILPTGTAQYGDPTLDATNIAFQDSIDPTKAQLVSVYYPTTAAEGQGGFTYVFSDDNTRPSFDIGGGVDIWESLVPENPGTLTDLVLNDTNDIISFVLVASRPSDPVDWRFLGSDETQGGSTPDNPASFRPTLTVVPEPASAALLGVGALAMLRARRTA